MNTIELLAVGVRLLGVYFLLQFVQFLGSSYSSYYQMASSLPEFNPFFVAGGYAFTAMLMLAFALVFIKFPATVAGWLVPKIDKDSSTISGSLIELQLTGFTLLGVYILSWAIPDLIHNSALLAVIPHYDESYLISDRPYDVINIVVTAVEIVIGLFLTLQAKGLVRLINKFRYAGA